ncbi:MAG: YqaE/Pmp3 family membrane protein [Desulfobacteraceae bacterium]|nr:YqaE/Pmp3 family membrane protein [Desulfobacteraceae bacterium]
MLIILAILLPPVAVFLKNGVGKDFIINIVLCLLFYIPGILHALWLVTK